MGFRKKDPDPISDRARELNAKIAALESKIKRLNNELQPGDGPRLRSTTYPGGSTESPNPPASQPHSSEPIFEKVDQNPLKAPVELPEEKPRDSDLGVRKNSGESLWERLKKEFRPPPASNPKLVNYLAAGSIQGLRPLRYEKRVMRNRCIGLAVLLLVISFCIIYALTHRH